MTTTIDARAIVLGDRFAEMLREDLTPEQYAEVVRFNRTKEYSTGSCASAGVCDSNMLMLAAWQEMFGEGVTIDADDQKQAALWNAAWEHARKAHLGHYIENPTILDLAADARCINDDDWGSEMQIEAENLFFATASAQLPGSALEDLETAKATTNEMIDIALVRISLFAIALATDDLDAALAPLQEHYGITDGGIASVVFSDTTFDWSTASEAAREAMLGRWIAAERAHAMGAEPPVSLLALAAATDDRDAAVKLIADALGIDPTSRACTIHVTWPERWARFGRESRLAEIGGWLAAEATEERLKTCVVARTPMQTVGTND